MLLLRVLLISDRSPVWITINWHQEDMGKPTKRRITEVLTSFMDERNKPVAYLLTDAFNFSVLDEWRDDQYFKEELNL